MENIDGVSCIKGEIHSIMTLMRLSTRWSNAKNTRSTQLEESPFVNSYRRLNEYLEGLFDLSEVDCVKYLTPFHEVIVSDQASGPLTSAALSSVCKFAMFGFLSTKNPRSEQGISLVAQCISKCIFEETDWESDEVILMKLLELSTLTLRCDASKLLSVSAAWDIYSTCLSIHNQYRASKILRSEAETALRHLTQSTFSRAHNLLKLSDETTSPSTQFDEIDLANRSWDAVSQTYTFDGTVGVTLLLCNIMSVLSNLMNLQTENAVRVKFSLSLVNIALEAGGPTLSLMLPLVDILKGDVSRHLLRATQSEDLEIFSLALRVVFNLFMSIKNHMKVQLEVFLTSIHLRLLQHHQSTFLGQAKQELTLESLLEFCREPSLMQDLYTNYDCDVQCTNLFDAIITVLCERCQPQRAIRSDVDTSNGLPSEVDVNGKATITNRLALAGVSSILHAVATKCRKAKSQANEFYPRESTRASTATFFDLSSTTPPPPLLSRESTGQIQDDPVYSENLRKLEAVYRSSGDDGAMSQSESEGDFVGLNVSQSAEFRALRKQDDFGIANSVGTSSPASSNSSFRLPDKAVNLSMVSIYGEESEIAESSFAANSVEVLRQRKLRKQRLLHTAELFNEKPLKLEWVRFAIDQQLIDPYKEGTDVADIDEAYPADAKSLALFLKNTPGLGKTEIGEYLSKGPADKYPFHVSVLREYVNTFDFTGKDASFVKALRTFLGHFRLPGEAQCIDRLMEAFARKLFEDLGVGKPFASADAAYVLAFSTIMLQTDLHNPNVTHKRMSKEEFIRNNRGINDGDSLPKEYLEALYDEIKARKIEVDIDMNDNNELMQAFNLTDTNSWNKLINKNAAYQAPAAFTSTTAARRGAKDYTLTGFDPSASLHQKDMFLVMEERLLITIFALWQSCDDDSIISKTYQMLWDYVTICIDLQLTTLFNELVQTCAMKAKNILESSRKLTHNSRLQNKAVSNTFYQKLWSLEHEYGKHDLSRLLKASVEDLVATGNRGDIVSSEQVNWIGVSLVKGEIMIKFVLSVAATFFHDIDKTSSSTLLCFLIWIRGRGALPQSLAELSHSWVFQSREGSVDFSRFQPSLFSMMSHRRARGMKGRGASPSKQASSGSLLQSLGSLLFAPIPESESRGRKGESNLTPVDSDDLAAEQLKLDLNSCEYSHRLSRGNGENINMDRLLDIAISETPFQNVFGPNSKEMFGDMKNYDDTTGLLLEVFSTLAVNLLEESKSSNAQDIQLELTFPEKVSIRSHTREKTPAKEFSTSASRKEKEIRGLKEMVDHVTEMDVIFFAELITRITFKDPKKLWKYWNKIHDVLRLILEDEIATACRKFPLLVERMVLFALRCACEMIPLAPEYVRSESPEPGMRGSFGSEMKTSFGDVTHVYPSSTMANKKSDEVWQCIGYLRNLPVEIIQIISGQISFGILHFIRPTSGKLRQIQTLEEWYLVFSLLSATTVSSDSRPYVWASLKHIIEANLISDVNFSPARHLLLRFLFGIFGDEKDNDGVRGDLNLVEWQQQAMLCLVRLTNMALGGFVQDFASPAIQEALLKTTRKGRVVSSIGAPRANESISTSFYQQKTSTQVNPPQFLSFPLPSSKKAANSPVEGQGSQTQTSTIPSPLSKNSRQVNPKSNIPSIPSQTSLVSQPSSKESDAGVSQMTTVCVRFARSSDIDLFWIESCKTFADLSNSTNSAISYSAIYCLEAIMLSGSISGLDKEVFVKALNELLMRLPLSLQSASDRLHTSQVHPSSVQIVYDYSLSSCNLLFGILVANFKSIRSAHDFNACWLRFLSVLAANGSMLVRGSPIHNEVLDVISALLRVLRVPKTFAAISKRHSQQPQESQNGKDSMYSGESQQGSGWLSWWIGTPPPIQSTVSSNNVVSPAPVNVQPSLPIQQQDKVSNNVAPDGPDDTPIVSVSSGEEEDADLLTVSWKTICSIYSSFPAHLRIKYPTLVLEIAQFVDWLDRGSAKASVSTSSSVDEVTNTEPRIDRLTMSVVSKESVNDMPSPSSSMTPTSSTSSNGRIQVV